MKIKTFQDFQKEKPIKNYKLEDILYESNKITNGFNENETIIIAARPGCGKTTLMIDLMVDFVYQQDLKCLFVSCEMSGKELSSRVAKILTKDDDFNPKNILIDDNNEIDLNRIESIIKFNKPKIVFIDYIQLLKGKIRDNSKGLKELARKYHTPIFIAAQLNRLAENKEPKLSMIKDCGGIEQDADQVGFITENYIDIAKNRKGKTGKFPIHFFKEDSLICYNKYGWNDINTNKEKINPLLQEVIELLKQKTSAPTKESRLGIIGGSNGEKYTFQ